MKIRSGFVSNSSSSSFIISKHFLSPYQIEQIYAHTRFAGNDAWIITETGTEIRGETSMDNFNMAEYLIRINVDMRFVKDQYED
jgi:hypothetical protein